jgi:hypothetical protein
MCPEIFEKWGFGMARPKVGIQRERTTACRVVAELLNTPEMPKPTKELLGFLSVAKGLFNRIVREDQWDWFTVSCQLGYPSRGLARAIANELSNMRCGIRDCDKAVYLTTYVNLSRLPIRRCLSVFLGIAHIKNESDAGWVYVLSTRELRDLLKIGMTTRSVEMRAQEINGATGVAVPFGVRRCWRVRDPNRAETIVHNVLANYRIRNDREFFRIDFPTAAPIIQNALDVAKLEIRTLNALAGLSS